MLRTVLIGLGLALLASAASGQAAEGYEHFEKHIRPLLAEKCYACHSAETMAQGDLTVDSKARLAAGRQPRRGADPGGSRGQPAGQGGLLRLS